MKPITLFKHFYRTGVTLILCSCVHHATFSQSFQWVKPVTGPGQNVGMTITMDAAGNTYTAGWFSGTSDFDPGPGNFNMTCNGTYDGFIQKLDANGNFVWAKKTGGN